MNFLKKWTGCILSFVAGVLGLSLGCINGLTLAYSSDTSAASAAAGITIPEASFSGSTSVYEMVNDATIQTELVFLKVLTIVILVMSALLIVNAIVLQLKNLNVIKSSHIAFDIVTYVLVGLFAVVSILFLVVSILYANGVAETALETLQANYAALPVAQLITYNVKSGIGAYQPIMVVVSVITAIATSVFTALNRKAN